MIASSLLDKVRCFNSSRLRGLRVGISQRIKFHRQRQRTAQRTGNVETEFDELLIYCFKLSNNGLPRNGDYGA